MGCFLAFCSAGGPLLRVVVLNAFDSSLFVPTFDIFFADPVFAANVRLLVADLEYDPERREVRP